MMPFGKRVKNARNHPFEERFAYFVSSKCVNFHRNEVGDANGIGALHLLTTCHASGDDIFGSIFA